MRVLLSAYACAPGAGSEPGIGWNWVEQVARSHRVWVLTRRNNAPQIEAALAKRPMPNVHWEYLDLPAWARFWKRGQHGVRAYYYAWQLAAYARARRLDRAIGFDVAHHVTFGSYWMPSLLGRLGVPFVWGPVGGGESAPRGFYRALSRRGRYFEYARDVARSLGERDPLVRQAARRAGVVLATTPETAVRASSLGARDVRVVSHAALPAEDIARLGRYPIRTTGPFRAVSVGRLVDWKGFHLGLAAFAELRRSFPTSEYWIVGDGPDRRRLERLIAALGMESAVVLTGWMSRDQIFERLGECDVLIHPSLHDSGGWVCAEAMAARRPVVCLALGGPAMQVTSETGFAVPADSPGAAVGAMAAALLCLARDPDVRVRMGEAARDRVIGECSWAQRGELIEAVYAELTGRGGARVESSAEDSMVPAGWGGAISS